jgi:hypothetical protein
VPSQATRPFNVRLPSGLDSLHGSSENVATYAQPIKNKKSPTRKAPARPAAKARPATAPKAEPAAAPSAEPGELQRLKDELQRVNQEISRLARVGRPDAGRQSNLPEKQGLLQQKVDLERKIRTRPNA